MSAFRKGYRLYEEEEMGYALRPNVVNNGDLSQSDNISIQRYIDDNVDPLLNGDPDLIKHINDFDFDKLLEYLPDQNRRPTTERMVFNGRPFLVTVWLDEDCDDEYGYYYEGTIKLTDMKTNCVWSFVDRDIMEKFFEWWEEDAYDTKMMEYESQPSVEDDPRYWERRF